MPMRNIIAVPLLVFALLLTTSASHGQSLVRYNIGHAATPDEIKGWNIDIGRDGTGLPPGRGSVAQGRTVYAEQCAVCHGPSGEGGLGDKLAGGQGTLAMPKPVKTVGSFWPYAPTLFDYIRRAMPLNAPQSLSNEDVYAVSAYILNLNGLLPADASLDATTLSAVKMPNRAGFTDDPRPDVKK
jgi:hypothetical protein